MSLAWALESDLKFCAHAWYARHVLLFLYVGSYDKQFCQGESFLNKFKKRLSYSSYFRTRFFKFSRLKSTFFTLKVQTLIFVFVSFCSPQKSIYSHKNNFRNKVSIFYVLRPQPYNFRTNSNSSNWNQESTVTLTCWLSSFTGFASDFLKILDKPQGNKS